MSAKPIKIGVVGVHRGRTMIEYCKHDKRVKLTGVCDFRKDALDQMKDKLKDDSIAYYTDFEDLLNSDVDGIVLANYANEHAPLAIKCLERGKHVLSEVLPVQNFAEAVALTEAVENREKFTTMRKITATCPLPAKCADFTKKAT